MSGDGLVDGRADEPWLLAAPRGRRLCYELLVAAVGRGIPYLGWEGQPEEVAGALAGLVDEALAGGALAGGALAEAAAQDEGRRFLPSLVESVAAAMYWQEPHPEDRALGSAALREVLRPLALAVAGALPGWWAEPVALDRQRVVAWEGTRTIPGVPVLTVPSGGLEEWRRDAVEAERRAERERPADVRAPWSGTWWSTPSSTVATLPPTSRVLPGLGAAGLVLVEDSLGWTAAECLPVEPARPPRVQEVHGPQDWVDLVSRHPLEVTFSRRHDWFRTTGVDGRWFVPDWPAVARDVDAVHVSVRGYLRSAGLPLPAADGWTLLAGWEPDTTWWLTDCLRVVGDGERWVHDDQQDPLGWRLAHG